MRALQEGMRKRIMSERDNRAARCHESPFGNGLTQNVAQDTLGRLNGARIMEPVFSAYGAGHGYRGGGGTEVPSEVGVIWLKSSWERTR